MLHDSLRKTGCYIVGGVAPQEYFDLLKSYGITNVHFVEFKKKDELKKYYQAADIFVHPTREDIWGLVVNEAMAQGLPVISTNRCIAALELINDGKNGFVVPVEDEQLLAAGMNRILQDENLQYHMSQKALSIIDDYTIEKMAQAHLKIWNK